MPLLAPPLVPQFPAGFGPQPADFTGWVTNTLGFQTAGIVFRAQQAVQQALAFGLTYVVTYDTVLEDPYGGWTGTSPPAGFPNYAWIAPYTGFLEVEMFCSIAAAATNLQATILVTGVTAYTPTQAQLTSLVTGGGSAFLRVPVVGGQDYIQATVTSSADTTTDVSSAGRLPEMSISYISQ